MKTKGHAPPPPPPPPENLLTSTRRLVRACREGDLAAARSVVEESGGAVSVDARGPEGWTCLQWAVGRGRVDVAEWLVEQGADLNAREEGGMSPLCLALKHGHLGLASLLVEKGADVKALRKDEAVTPLNVAADEDLLQIVQVLVAQGVDVNAKGRDGRSPLHAAKSVDVAKILLTAGADINARDDDGETPLHAAARDPARLELALFFVEAGADVNAANRDGGVTPLHIALRERRLTLAARLIEAGADVNARTNGGQSLLLQAVMRDDTAAASLLLESGAHVNNVGDSANLLQLALARRLTRAAALMVENGVDVEARFGDDRQSFLHLPSVHRQPQVARLLVDGGLDANVKNSRGETPLHVAARDDSPYFAKVILGLGARVDERSSDESTPLHAAAESKNEEMVKVLLAGGADVDSGKAMGLTPLHLAARQAPVVVRQLLDAGACVNSVDCRGETPLHAASREDRDRLFARASRILLEGGALVNARRLDGDTPLHVAARNNCENVARLLVDKGADVNAGNLGSWTPLHAAVSCHFYWAAEALLKLGADLNASAANGWTPLHAAAKCNNYKVSKMVFEGGADINARDKEGSCPLSVAIKSDSVEVAEMLIGNGANLNVADDDHNETPLHLASKCSDPKIARLLVDKGANVDLRSKHGWTPLHLSLMNQQPAIATMLVQKGADVDAKSDDGWTGLHLAATFGYVQVVEILLRRGAQVGAGNGGGETALHLAARHGHLQVATTLICSGGAGVDARLDDGRTPLHLALMEKHPSVAALLLGKGADPGARNNQGWTPLHLALIRDQPEMVPLLVDKGADATATLSDGATPLHLAARNDHPSAARLLLEEGADVNARCSDRLTPLQPAIRNNHAKIAKRIVDKRVARGDAKRTDGWTPLHLASFYGHIEVARVLVRKGADVDARRSDGWTPLHLASRDDHSEVARLLVESGADANVATARNHTPLSLAFQHVAPEVGEVIASRVKQDRKRCNVFCDSPHPARQECWGLVNSTGDDAKRARLASVALDGLCDGDGERGALLGERRDGQSLFSQACKNGLADTAECLLAGDASLLNDGVPHPMWLAVHYEQLELLKRVFVPRKADVDLPGTRAPDGTSPLMMAALKQSGDLLDVLREIYDPEDIFRNLVEFGCASLLDSTAPRPEMFCEEMLRDAVRSGSADTVRKVKAKAPRPLKPTWDELARCHNREILAAAFDAEGSRLWPRRSSLTEMTRRYPKFNDRVEAKVRPGGGRHYQALSIREDLASLFLKRPCCLPPTAISTAGKRSGRLIRDLTLKDCDETCRQKAECLKSRDLLLACKLLETDMNERGGRLMRELKPAFVLIGSTEEGTRLGRADEMDLTVRFEGLEEDGHQFRLLGGSDATKLTAPPNHPLMRDFSSADNNDGEEAVFNFPEFFHFLLDQVRSSLLWIEDAMPYSLSFARDWTPCDACEELSARSSRSVYAPISHCARCLPDVTHTKIGPCLIFTHKADDGSSKSVLTVDLIPVFPLSSRGGACALFRAVNRTLMGEKPENWLEHLRGVAVRDRVLPDAYVSNDEDASSDAQTISLKLLNYGPGTNYVIRPGQRMVADEFGSNERLKEVYVHVKAVKAVLAVDVSSFFVKKVLLGFAELKWRLLSPDRPFLLDEALLSALSHPELASKFRGRIEFDEWRRDVDLRRDGGRVDGRHGDEIPLQGRRKSMFQRMMQMLSDVGDGDDDRAAAAASGQGLEDEDATVLRVPSN